MKKLILGIILIFAALFNVVSISAQETPEEIAKKYGITFPIAELGNCSDISSCRTFCEDPLNQNTCIEFAKQKGFYNEESIKVDIRNNQFWARTRSELGCDSESSCRAYCEVETNFEKCSNFAKRQGLSGGHTEDPKNAQILNKAKEILGCTSYESCMTYCSSQENYTKCSEFAREAGLRGGEHQAGPGGCTSEETCQKFCSDPQNYKICSQYSSSEGESFSGPGGCTTEASCRAYCEKNPQECRYLEDINRDYDPSEMCNKTPDCAWVSNSCQCTRIEGMDPEEYCKKYPDRCSGYTDAATECAKYSGCSWTNNSCQCSSQQGSYDPATECAKYPGCSWNGTTCACSSQGTSSGNYNYDPATECTKYPGCSWTNNSCQCASPTGSSDTGSYQYPTGYDPATECAKHSGCSWTNNTCQCSSQSTSQTTPYPTSSSTSGEGSSNYSSPTGSSSYDPATECAKYPGCSWTGSTCQCSSVQGERTERNFLEAIWDFLFGG